MLMVEKPKFGGLWFESSTYVQLVIGASVHCKVSPLTPSMCNTVALDFKPQKLVSNLGPTRQISCYESNRTKSFGICALCPRPQHNKRYNPLPWALSPENRCQTWDTWSNFPVLNQILPKFGGPWFESSS